MNIVLLIACVLMGLVLTFLSFPDGAISLLITLAISLPAILFLRTLTEEKYFITNIFFLALLLRILLGLIIYLFGLRGTFGPDSYHYEYIGARLAQIWADVYVPNDYYAYRARNPGSSGWGMIYLVASIFTVFGRNFFIAQTFCGVVGALTAPLTYLCSNEIFKNKNVSKFTAVAVAAFPSFVIWSSQLMKDGLITFLLVLSMLMVLQLQKKFDYFRLIILILSLLGIISLRFYIFYMVALAVAGSFLVGVSTSVQTITRNVIIIVFLGLGLTYLGVMHNAKEGIDKYASLERIQTTRRDLAESASTGFGEDIDVSTPAGAIAAVPIGLIYLFFAPFPWDAVKLSQFLVIPETLVWWSLIPLMIIGLKYSILHRLRETMPVLLFTLMLILAYSIFQGNVGMLYRQRTQFQVFLFMFIAVGWELYKERKENKKLILRAQKLRNEKRLTLYGR
jgi:hypothetical protein